MDVIVIVIIICCIFLFRLSAKNGEIQEPLANSESLPKTYGVPLTFIVLGIIGVLLMGLSGNALQNSAYAVVQENGKEALDMFVFSSLIACVGLLMIINGIARGMGVLLFIIGVIASVIITEMS